MPNPDANIVEVKHMGISYVFRSSINQTKPDTGYRVIRVKKLILLRQVERTAVITQPQDQPVTCDYKSVFQVFFPVIPVSVHQAVSCQFFKAEADIKSLLPVNAVLFADLYDLVGSLCNMLKGAEIRPDFDICLFP